MTQDSTDANLYIKSGVTLAENDLFKIKTNANVWYANESGWDGKNYSLDSGNMKVTKAGVYNIKYHSDWNYNKIDFEAASLYSTFTVTYDSLASGYDIYLCGIDEDWSIVSANKLTPTGAANTYSITKLASNETLNFKYVISNGNDVSDWNTLNPDGNRTFTLGQDYSYSYEAITTKYTITFNVNYDTGYGKSIFVTGDFAGWSCNTNYVLTWTDGNYWTGSFEFEEGTEFKVVVGPSAGGSVSRWTSGDNIVADGNKTISSVIWS